MFEIILIVGVIVSFFYASSQSGKISQLKQDIDRLKKDVQALQLAKSAGDLAGAAAENQAEIQAERAADSIAATQPETLAAERADETLSGGEQNPAPTQVDNVLAQDRLTDDTLAGVAANTSAEAEPVAPPDSVDAMSSATPAKPKESLESRLGARWTVLGGRTGTRLRRPVHGQIFH